MSKVFKNSVILGLAFTLVMASVFCCCIPDSAHAQESLPECHQTSHETDSAQDHNTEDCDCPVITSITIEKANNNFDLAKSVFNFIPIAYQEYASFIPTVPAYQASPIFYDTSPLYIKHSILRI